MRTFILIAAFIIAYGLENIAGKPMIINDQQTSFFALIFWIGMIMDLFEFVKNMTKK